MLYISDLQELEDNTVAIFAENAAILATGNNFETTGKLQVAVNRIQSWTNRWKIKLVDQNRSISTSQKDVTKIFRLLQTINQCLMRT